MYPDNTFSIPLFFLKNPHMKQQEAVNQLGKSLSTIKRLTADLIAKGLIERKNGKRDGFWVVKKS